MSCTTIENIESRPQTVPAYASIKDDSWRQQVVTDIKINSKVIEKSDKSLFYGKNVDPLTNLRDVLRQLSNQEAFRYMRQCRLIVAKLKQCWVEINEEIKSLTKSKEYLESSIEHIRKDLVINQETIDNRVHRPARETEQDGVDEILNAEKQHLITLKRNLEIALKPVQTQIYKLDDTRELVFKLGRERSRVTDLICQCLTQALRTYDAAASDKNNSNSKLKHANSSVGSTRVNSNINNLTAASSTNNLSTVGPLSAFTPETIEIMDLAAQQIAEGKDLRRKGKQAINESMENAKLAGKTVEDYFVKKISESVTLSQNLNVGIAENKLAQNRAVRWNELSDLSLKYSLGPEKTMNLQTYERLDRPIIKSFQKHPGNQVPEAQEMIKGSESLVESVKATNDHVKTLKIIGQRLSSNMKDKEAAASVDCALLRRRRALSNHKWVPVKYVKETQPMLTNHKLISSAPVATTSSSSTAEEITTKALN